MSNTLEPTKRDVFETAEYLGCNEEELWSEVSKLLQRQDTYARIDELKKLPLDVHATHGSHTNMCIPTQARNSRLAELKEPKL